MMYRVIVQNGCWMKTLLYPQWMTCHQQKYNIVSFLPAAEMDVSGLMRRLTWDLELGAGGQWSPSAIRVMKPGQYGLSVARRRPWC